MYSVSHTYSKSIVLIPNQATKTVYLSAYGVTKTVSLYECERVLGRKKGQNLIQSDWFNKKHEHNGLTDNQIEKVHMLAFHLL